MPILPTQQDKDEKYENYGATGHPKHPTYYNKPKPTMQIVSEAAQFNDRTRSSLAYENYSDVIKNPDLVPAVPTTWDTVYDPAHPDADWTGLVNKNHVQKKHSRDHISLRENIVRTEHGIVSNEDRHELGRKKGPEDPSIALRNAHGSIVIGGIDEPDERWRTTHHRMELREPTQKDQLTLERRAGSIKKVSDPAQSRSQFAQIADGSSYGIGLSFNQMPSSQVKAVRATPSVSFGGRSSLLSGIADKLAVEPPVRQPSNKIIPNYETNRLLMTENYRSYAPGYTGGRK